MSESAQLNAPGQRTILIAGTVVLAVLGAFAWTYYLERTACADSAFFSWLMIDEQSPVSVLGRYGSWLVQLPAVVLIWIGAPLRTVLHVYSLSFIIFHAIIYWILVFKLKDRRAMFALPITLTAGLHYMFYYGISELYQGLSFTILLWVVIGRVLQADARRSYFRWLALALALNVWNSFYHQLLVLPLIFILGYEFLASDRRGRIRLLLMGGVMVLWYLVRIKTMATSSYEQSRMPTVADLAHYSTHWLQLESTTYLFEVWTKFRGLLVLIAGGLVIGIVKRAWLRTAWTLVFSLLFLLLVLIVDRDGKAVMIFENYYPVLGLVWAVQFISLATGEGKGMAGSRVALFIAVCSLGLLQIHRAHYRISEKVAYAQRITSFWEAQGKPKILVKQQNYPWKYGIGEWAACFESALVSAVNDPARAATIFVSQDQVLLDSVRTRKDQFLGPEWFPLWFGLSGLDQRYFDFPTDTGYIWANTVDTTFDLTRLELRAPLIPFRMAPDRFSVVPIIIHNPTMQRMPSCTAEGKPVRLGYRLFRKDSGIEYVKGSEMTALETDIPPGMTYHQSLVIERPKDRGTYWVIADLLVDGQPFGKYATFDIVVDYSPF
ncbi:MAG: hypothetical protein IPI81_11975 [Flavobacteriales bacterium]|nr:hypothetical protein [Flavobacteriales bacterium]MCC6939121.1 hypothetical protein [Flavobacteriales bacterium]